VGNCRGQKKYIAQLVVGLLCGGDVEKRGEGAVGENVANGPKKDCRLTRGKEKYGTRRIARI